MTTDPLKRLAIIAEARGIEHAKAIVSDRGDVASSLVALQLEYERLMTLLDSASSDGTPRVAPGDDAA